MHDTSESNMCHGGIAFDGSKQSAELILIVAAVNGGRCEVMNGEFHDDEEGRGDVYGYFVCEKHN